MATWTGCLATWLHANTAVHMTRVPQRRGFGDSDCKLQTTYCLPQHKCERLGNHNKQCWLLDGNQATSCDCEIEGLACNLDEACEKRLTRAVPTRHGNLERMSRNLDACETGIPHAIGNPEPTHCETMWEIGGSDCKLQTA